MKKASPLAYLITTIVTLLNSMFGMIAIFFLIKYILLRNVAEVFPERYLTPVWVLLFFAGVFDVFDGLVARFTGTPSEFGRELDSLADAVSFGVLPALIIGLLNSFSDPYWQIFSWFCAIFYLSCVLFRLARFNIEALPEQKYHFQFKGLPSPGAAGAIGAIPLLFLGLRNGNILFNRMLWGIFSESAVIQFSDHLFVALPFMGLVLGLLMVSKKIVFFHTDKYIYFFKGKGFFHYLAFISVVLLIIFLFHEITLVLFAVFFYCGPLLIFFSKAKTRNQASQPNA